MSAVPEAPRAADAPVFDRPVFIVSSPRSGSARLFDALAGAPEVFTVGKQAHRLIEGIPTLDVRQRGFDSNRLDAGDATAPVVGELRRVLREHARDRDGAAPGSGPFRLLDKTPKNALRIPFLAEAFPEAHFLYYHRDPREVLAQMLLAWHSGQYRTYMGLPGWPHRYWALLLTPGWRGLADRSIVEIVVAQWKVALQILLDDLEALPAHRWRVVRHADLVDNPSGEIARLCLALDYRWDRPLDGGLARQPDPASADDAAVIRGYAAELQRLWPGVQPLAERAAKFAGG